jgi:MFS family permease
VISLRERAGALAERPFRLLWLGQTTSAIGDALVPVALAFAVFQIGGGGAALGLVLASLTIGRTAFVLVGGVWGDRLPRRLVMLTCDVVRALVDAFIAVALLTGATGQRAARPLAQHRPDRRPGGVGRHRRGRGAGLDLRDRRAQLRR